MLVQFSVSCLGIAGCARACIRTTLDGRGEAAAKSQIPPGVWMMRRDEDRRWHAKVTIPFVVALIGCQVGKPLASRGAILSFDVPRLVGWGHGLGRVLCRTRG